MSNSTPKTFETEAAEVLNSTIDVVQKIKDRVVITEENIKGINKVIEALHKENEVQLELLQIMVNRIQVLDKHADKSASIFERMLNRIEAIEKRVDNVEAFQHQINELSALIEDIHIVLRNVHFRLDKLEAKE